MSSMPANKFIKAGHSSVSVKDIEEIDDEIDAAFTDLERYGQPDMWLKFNKLLAKNNFPTNNIEYLLFSDIVNFFSLDSPYSIQYHSEAKQFWSLGYKIFRERSFMGGDQISSRTSDQHNDNNMINFMVPDQMILQNR